MEETVIHALTDCPKAKEVWMVLGQAKVDIIFFSQDVVTWLDLNLVDNSSFHSIHWNQLFGITCWLLWSWRNKLVFDDDFVWLLRPDIIVWQYVREMQSSKLAFGPMQARGLRHWLHIGWEPPPVGWIKINFDGAVKGNPGWATVPGLARDSEGK
ncbi:Ribonuclease H [Quillaja saponaria]|uniref:Ribonuclease H n=1 Tax=Quillaja saponaria TaxID=32244 RepID=A0AAD7QAY1_QUISA|nr:Ribonuclease H [Quillaja saponaria]